MSTHARRILLVAIAWLALAPFVSAQEPSAGSFVTRGATCPPVSAPAGGAGALYTCTASGAAYVWNGSSWVAVGGGGGSITGADTQVLFFDGANSPSGDDGLTYNKTSNVLSFLSGGGASFAGVASPITVKGGNDGFGDSALIVDDATDNYITLKFNQGTDVYTSAGFAITNSASGVEKTALNLGDTGAVLQSRNAALDVSTGTVIVTTGNTSGTGGSGDITLNTGSTDDDATLRGLMTLGARSVNINDLSIVTGSSATTQVLYNDAGVVSGDSGLTFDKDTGALTIGGTATAAEFLIPSNSVLWSIEPGSEYNDADNYLIAKAATDDYPTMAVLGKSDGFAGGGWDVWMTSALGDKNLAGDALPVDTTIALLTLTADYNDTTDPTSFVGYLYLRTAPVQFHQPMQFKANGDIGFTAAYNDLTNGNLFLAGATGNGIFRGSVTATDHIIGNGSALKTDTTTAHTALIQAYDVNAAAYVPFVTLTNANAPTFVLAPSGDGTVSVRANEYQSSDGTSGATGTCAAFPVVKNGLVVSCGL